MHSFETDRAAKEFVRGQVDVPASERVENLGEGVMLHTFSYELDESKFTNVYDLSFPIDHIRPSITLPDRLTSVFDHAKTDPGVRAATGGGFFFLVDQASAVPRQLGLNLAVTDGQIHNLPVVDREAVFVGDERLRAEHLQALGVLSLNGTELSWSGSLTTHETDTKVFANGNSVIAHVKNDETGSMRVLDESSRYTPVIYDEETVDIGFIRREDGVFIGINSSSLGELDIFSHDVVIRAHERYVHGALPEMHIRTLGNKAIGNAFHAAVSVGPMLDVDNFTTHPINTDASLGGKPPFLDVPLARTVLYETNDDRMCIRLFDGRPGSPVFPGVTPQQAVQSIKNECDVVWGCFLDPGQTAKLIVRNGEDIASYGNAHYLKWPKRPGEKFIWVPKSGRPVASMISLH